VDAQLGIVGKPMTTRPSTDKALDAFVTGVNAGVRPRRPEDEVPVGVRTGAPDADGLVEWIIRRIDSAPWIEQLEQRLPRPFPPSFRSLVMRYAFPSFDIGRVHLFANTGDTSGDEELVRRVFADRVLAGILLKSGFIQIGWRTDVWYDPVCFDTSGRRGGGEYPLVRLDHEAALRGDEVRLVERVAPSFLDLLR
jgi:hypothetical protein